MAAKMSKVVKRRKVDSECRIFNEKWSEDYFFVQSNDKIICLICKDSVAVLKEYNLRRHYETKHKDKYAVYKGNLRIQKLESLKKGLEAQQNIFKKKFTENLSAVQASYRVAYLLAANGKPFTDGDFVKTCMLVVAEEVCPEKVETFKNVSLSATTITRRVEDLGEDLFLQLKEKSGTFDYFSIALDESTDVCDTAQLLIFIRGIDESMNITEDLAALHSLKGTTTGEDIFIKVLETMTNLNLEWNKLVSVTSDGAKNMCGTGTGLVGRINQKMESVGANRPMALHCIIHQQSLCGKSLNLDHIMKTVVSTVNFIRAHGLNHRQFQTFLDEIQSNYRDIIYHSEVRWLSRGKVLKRFLELRSEIEMFMNEKGHPVLQLSDSNWIWQLAFLTDLTQHINDLNLKLQGKGKLICEMFSNVKAFQMKLKLFHAQILKNNLIHFESCENLKKENKLDTSFPKYFFLTTLNSLEKQFEERFQDFHHHSGKISLFENPFSAVVEETPESMQLELIELQTNEILKSKYKEGDLLEFYKCLSSSDFPNFKSFASSMITIYASTYLCEQTFSKLKYAKSKLRSRLTDDHLHSVLRIGVSGLKPNFLKLCMAKQAHCSH